MDIVKAFPLLMDQEGIKLTNVAGDKGGLTKYGISQAAYPKLNIANLTQQEAQDIYLDNYWVPAKISSLPSAIQYAHFSCAVNCGVGSAARILQRACRVTDDGIIGPGTLAAAEKLSIYDYCIEWNNHYKAIIEAEQKKIIAEKGEAIYNQMLQAGQTQQKFMAGWQKRINDIITWSKAGQLN